MMAAAGVPVLAELDPATVSEQQLPVLVKASAGGGGRGMRIVHSLAELDEQVRSARREAQSAFGDPTVFCERYLPRGRHIEVQVMADRYGTLWAVGERECSIQRRHQKIIEEAPSPLVQRIPAMRERLFTAARLAATAIAYTGAGTVEFLADENGEFFFLEMNTRLQVEHPVTELTTGLDLVELQLAVADGEALPAEPPATTGHSIEARLYAEDPARGWQPQAGRIDFFEVLSAAAHFGPLDRTGIRLDSGITGGSVVSIHYDPMLAKVISHAPTRSRAAQMLADALARTRLHGLRTNRDLLVNVLQHPAFLAGDTDTAFFDTHGLDRLAAPLAGERAVRLSLIAAAIAGAAHNRVTARVLAGLPGGWRNVVSADQVKTFLDADAAEHQVRYRFARTGLDLPDDPDVSLVSATPAGVVLTDAGVATAFDVARYGAEIYVDSPHGCVRFTAAPRFPEATSAEQQGSLLAPMPGAVVRLGAGLGDTVTAGQPLVWLEAMKMEHIIASPAAGVLTELSVAVGQQVGVGAVLARVETQGGSDD
jgi:propionyl-CoA carboxylase alpha chain